MRGRVEPVHRAKRLPARLLCVALTMDTSMLTLSYHRIRLAPEFSGLRRFKDGRRFKQWTGDDSKALMKVCFPAA
jgi:hypothetical protein